ncbi:MAG: transporter substrate-binding domain-containing protein [Pseudomonadota bacterium]
MADELAPTGVLRAIFLGSNPVQGTVDSATGAVSGPAAELTAALAREHGLRWTIAPVGGTQAVIDGVNAGGAEIGFLAFDPLRAALVDFTQPYSLAYNAYLLPAGSPIRSSAEIDRPGIRIGVGERDAADLYLSRTIKQATLQRLPAGPLDALVGAVRTGAVDAYAANRHRLTQALAQLPGARLLDDNFLAVEQARHRRQGRNRPACDRRPLSRRGPPQRPDPRRPRPRATQRRRRRAGALRRVIPGRNLVSGLMPVRRYCALIRAVLEIAAGCGALGGFVPCRQPVAQRIAVPRRLWPQRRQAELVPDRLGAFHVRFLRQRQRRHVALHGRVHQQGRILFLAVLALGPVALAAMGQGLQIGDRVHAIGHRP